MTLEGSTNQFPNRIQMSGPNNSNSRRDYQDLEERTFRFAKDIRKFVSEVPKNPSNLEDIPQLVRASGSTAANYLEANDSLGKKDFLMRLRIARKEAKEARLFLRLLDCEGAIQIEERSRLVKEAMELKLILSTIIKNSGG